MLFSNNLNNASNYCESDDDVQLIEKCYRSMCDNDCSSNGNVENDTQPNHNYNRMKWRSQQQQQINSTIHLNQQKMISKHHQPKQSKYRTITLHSSSYAFKAFILFFIVLLSNDEYRSVHGARSRDSLISIYQNNNHSVNNVIKNELNASAAIENSIDINIDLPIVDDADLLLFNDKLSINGTDDDAINNYFNRYANNNAHKLRRSPIYQNEFAVFIPNGADLADSIASKHGFTNMGTVSCFILFSFIFH